MPNRDAYVERMKIQLDELNAGLDQLEGKVHIAEVQLMTACQSEMSTLRLQLRNALAKLDEVKPSGENAWEHLKAETERAHDALVYSLHDFKSRS